MNTIAVLDPKVEQRLQRCLAQLEEFYPDKIVSRLDAEHKKLGEKLSLLYKEIGYQSRIDLLSAYGFAVLTPKGGRPTTTNPKEVLVELHKRYEGKELPSTTNMLAEQNPDLASQIKTLQNKSKELFGDTFKNILLKEGLLQGRVKQHERADGDRMAKQTVKDLDLLVEFLVSRHSASPNSEKPKSVPELKKLHPDKEPALTFGQREWGKSHNETFVEMLRSKGVLKAQKRSEASERRAQRSLYVRNAPVDELVAVLKESGCPALLTHDDKSAPLLPERIAGIDFAHGVELRVSTFCGIATRKKNLEAGNSMQYEAGDSLLEFKDAEGRVIFSRSYPDEDKQFLELVNCPASARSASPLAKYEGATIVSNVARSSRKRFMQVRVAYLHELTTQTLINLMWKGGLIGDDDLVGSDAWRNRDYAGMWPSGS